MTANECTSAGQIREAMGQYLVNIGRSKESSFNIGNL